MGLAIGFIMGGAINRMVMAFVGDIINPIVSLIFGSSEGLASFSFKGIAYGHFIAAVIDFVILAAVIYYIFKGFRLDKLDIKKDKQ